MVVAVGALNFAPNIPGLDSPKVRDAWKVLSGEHEVSGRVAVIGGGLVGCETAEHLAERGCKVSVVEMRDSIGVGVGSTVLPTLLENYRTYGVEQFPGHTVHRITADALVCENKRGDAVKIPYDYVVTAIGARSVPFDTSALREMGTTVIKVGDCSEVADIAHAIKTGYDAANAI